MIVFDPIDLPLSFTTQEDVKDTVECKFKNTQCNKPAADICQTYVCKGGNDKH